MVNHNFFNAAQEKREIDAALEEYRLAWPRFLREDLGITLSQLRSLDTSVLMALIILRLNEYIGIRLNDHEARLRDLENDVPRPVASEGRGPSSEDDAA